MKKFNIVQIQSGRCPVCDKKTFFVANDYWLRDHYHCIFCKSIPRQRALVKILKSIEPEYKKMSIHESSPSGPTFKFFRENIEKYSYSYFYENRKIGEDLENGGKNENLENLSFEDESFDIFITQDVMEHVNNPNKAFKEINRVLKKGGIHIFTTPIYPFTDTKERILIDNKGKIIKILPPIYHGNPISSEGSLVTIDYGRNIIEYIRNATGMQTKIIEFPNNKENFKSGLQADFLQVLVTRKDENIT